MQPVAPPKANGKPQGKLRLTTLSDLDRRTLAFKRTTELIGQVEQDLGGSDQLSAAERQLIQRGCILGSIAEHLEVQWLDGAPVDSGEYALICNAQRRMLMAIGLNRRARDALAPRPSLPPMRSLSDMLKAREVVT